MINFFIYLIIFISILIFTFYDSNEEILYNNKIMQYYLTQPLPKNTHLISHTNLLKGGDKVIWLSLKSEGKNINKSVNYLKNNGWQYIGKSKNNKVIIYEFKKNNFHYTIKDKYLTKEWSENIE